MTKNRRKSNNGLVIDFILESGDTARFKRMDDQKILMMFTETITCQWPLDQLGVQLETAYTGGPVKLGMWNTACPMVYQSIYFRKDEMKIMHDYFAALGFPLPTSPFHNPQPAGISP